jgi:hypothetical protein
VCLLFETKSPSDGAVLTLYIKLVIRPTHSQIDALVSQLEELTTFLDRLTLLQPDESYRAILSWSKNGKVPDLEQAAGPLSAADSAPGDGPSGPTSSTTRGASTTSIATRDTSSTTLPQATARRPGGNRSRSPERRPTNEAANHRRESSLSRFSSNGDRSLGYADSTQSAFPR